MSKSQARKLGILNETNKNKFNVAAKEDRILDGVLFSSRGEMIRYADLQQQEKSGEIKDLQRQVPFVVIGSFIYRGKKITQVRIIVDFTYYDRGRNWIIEDYKGKAQKDWVIKWKLLQQKFQYQDDVILKITTKEDIKY